MEIETTAILEPVELAVKRLCQFHGLRFNQQTAIILSLSPFEWPRVFADQLPDARRQRAEIRLLLTSNGLDFRELMPLDVRPQAMADSIAVAVASDLPVLLNSPDAAVIYGYDRREPDHWWWVDRTGTPEIVLESERSREFALWTDDPASGIVWVVIPGSATVDSASETRHWAFLEAIDKSVQGSVEDGVMPYPLSLRRFRDMLASTDSLPALITPTMAVDPLGILRAKVAREHLSEILEAAASAESDTAITQPLRLSQYHMHSSAASLGDMALALYGSMPDASAIDSLRVNWDGIRPRRRALELMTEILKSEKLAMESLHTAAIKHAELKARKPPVRRSTGRRR